VSGGTPLEQQAVRTLVGHLAGGNPPAGLPGSLQVVQAVVLVQAVGGPQGSLEPARDLRRRLVLLVGGPLAVG